MITGSKILVRVRWLPAREQRDRREAGEPDERRDHVALVLADQRGRERHEGDSTSTSSVIAIGKTASLKFATGLELGPGAPLADAPA
jgi:hypothetical protein